MAEEKAKLIVEIDDSKARQQAKKFAEEFAREITASLQKASSGAAMSGNRGSAGRSGVDAEVRRVEQLNNKILESVKRFKQLEEAEKRLGKAKGQEEALAKVKSEMASIIAAQRRRTQDQEQFNSLLERETNLRRQSRELNNKARGGGGGMLSGISDKVGGSSVGFDLGKAGTAAGLALAGAKALSLVTDALGQAGNKARENAKNFTDFGGTLDEVGQSSAKAGLAMDRLANNPAIQKAVAFFDNAVSRFFGGIGEAATAVSDAWSEATNFFRSEEEKQKIRAERKAEREKPLDLVGENKKEFDTLKRERAEMERDIARDRLDFERDIGKQQRDNALEYRQLEYDTQKELRDLAMERMEFELGAARQKQDLDIKAAREQEDYQRERQKFDEDFEGKMADLRYRTDREKAQRDFANKQRDARFDFEKAQRDKLADFQTQRGDKQFDFAKSQSRAAEDFGMQLTEMALGGADAKSYLLAGMRYNTERRRAQEDFDIEESRANRDFDIETGRENRDFETQTGRENRDFANQEADAARQRSFELMEHENQRRWELIQIETDHRRAVEDTNIALQRWQEDLTIGRTKLKNKEQDLAFSQGMRREEFANQLSDQQFDNTMRQADMLQNEKDRRRQQSEAEGVFAWNLFGGADAKNADSFWRTAINNPELDHWLNQETARQGRPGIPNQYRNGQPVPTLKPTEAATLPGFGNFAALQEFYRNNMPGGGVVPALPSVSGGGLPGMSVGASQVNLPLTVNAGLPSNLEAQLKALQQQYAQQASQLVQRSQEQNLKTMLNLLMQTGDARIR